MLCFVQHAFYDLLTGEDEEDEDEVDASDVRELYKYVQDNNSHRLQCECVAGSMRHSYTKHVFEFVY